MNKSSNCRTPYLHTTVEVNVPIKTVSTRKRYYYFKLADGIHPTEELNLKFLKAINEIQKDVQITTQVTILTMNPILQILKIIYMYHTPNTCQHYQLIYGYSFLQLTGFHHCVHSFFFNYFIILHFLDFFYLYSGAMLIFYNINHSIA